MLGKDLPTAPLWYYKTTVWLVRQGDRREGHAVRHHRLGRDQGEVKQLCGNRRLSTWRAAVEHTAGGPTRPVLGVQDARPDLESERSRAWASTSSGDCCR